MDSSLTYSVRNQDVAWRKGRNRRQRQLNINTGNLFSQGQVQVGTHSGLVGCLIACWRSSGSGNGSQEGGEAERVGPLIRRLMVRSVSFVTVLWRFIGGPDMWSLTIVYGMVCVSSVTLAIFVRNIINVVIKLILCKIMSLLSVLKGKLLFLW